MGWILLESLVALLILVGIVAWTMAPLRRRRRRAVRRERETGTDAGRAEPGRDPGP